MKHSNELIPEGTTHHYFLWSDHYCGQDRRSLFPWRSAARSTLVISAMIDDPYFSHDRWSIFPWRSAIVILAAIIISGIGDCYFHDKIWSFASLFTMVFASQFPTWFAMCPNIRTNELQARITGSLTCSIRSRGQRLKAARAITPSWCVLQECKGRVR